MLLKISRLFPIIFLLFLISCAPLPFPTTPQSSPLPSSAILPIPTSILDSPAIRARFLLREIPGYGRNPNALEMIGDKLYSLNTGTRNIAVIQNNRVEKFISIGKVSAAMAADPIQKRLYLSNTDEKSISMITNDQITLNQSIGEEARTILFVENRLLVGLSNKPAILVLDPATLQTLTTITIPNAFSIINLAGDSTNHRVYANVFEKTAVIDSTNWRYLSSIVVKGSYSTIVANSSSKETLIAAYDAVTQNEYLIAYDSLLGKERGRVNIGGDPRGAIVNRDGSRVYVANSFTRDVSVIDPRSLTIVSTVPVGLEPTALALDETAHRLYVANKESDNISVIDTQVNQVVTTIPLGMNPTALEANESAKRVYVSNASTDSVFVIQDARVIKEIGVGRHPKDIALDTQSNRLLVANEGDGTLTVIDEAGLDLRATVPITRGLTTVAVDSAQSRVIAGGMILDSRTLLPAGRLTLRGITLNAILIPDFVRVNPSNNRIYAFGGNGVPGSNSRRVTYSIDGSTLQQRAPLPYSGNSHVIAIDPNTNRVFVAGTHPFAFTNELNVFDSDDKRIMSLPLAARTTGMLFNPATQHLFLTHALTQSTSQTPNRADNMIQILNTDSFGEVAWIPVPNAPGKMARLGNMVYVASSDDGAITLIEDVNVPTPPSPTPTVTPSPFPISTPTRP